MDIVVVYDDRISEGIYGAKAIKLMKSFIESPEQLEQPPEIPQEIIDELKLKPIKDETDEWPAESKKPEKSKAKLGNNNTNSANKEAEVWGTEIHFNQISPVNFFPSLLA
jgi:hypothetical protein